METPAYVRCLLSVFSDAHQPTGTCGGARVHIVRANITGGSTDKNQDEPQPCGDFWGTVEAGGRRVAQGQGLLGLLVPVAFSVFFRAFTLVFASELQPVLSPTPD